MQCRRKERFVSPSTPWFGVASSIIRGGSLSEYAQHRHPAIERHRSNFSAALALNVLRADGTLELIGSGHIHGNVNRAIEAQLADSETTGPPPGGDAAPAAS